MDGQHHVYRLYGPEGMLDDHPSLNVLDEIDHGIVEVDVDEAAAGAPLPVGISITVRHYDRSGHKIEDRPLTDNERRFFYPDPHQPDEITDADRAYVAALADAYVHERLAEF